MFIFKLLFLPFVIIWRLVWGIISFIMMVEVLLAILGLLVLAAGYYFLAHGNMPQIGNIFHNVVNRI
jgi:hypothetical protein